MKKNIKVLFVGESCIAQSTEFKGFDNFFCTRYNESSVILDFAYGIIDPQIRHQKN